MSPPVEVTDDNVSIVSCLSNSVSRSKNKKGCVKRRHSVDFAGDHTVVEIDKADDQSREELWYTKPELESLKQRNGLIVRMVKCGKFEESDEDSFRGLERRLKSKGRRDLLDVKFNALNAVLEEQDRQYFRGKKNEHKMACKYEKQAEVAKGEAVLLALKDAEHVGGKPVLVVDDVDDCSVLSDMDTIVSEDSYTRRLRLHELFSGLSERKKHKARRRASC